MTATLSNSDSKKSLGFDDDIDVECFCEAGYSYMVKIFCVQLYIYLPFFALDALLIMATFTYDCGHIYM